MWIIRGNAEIRINGNATPKQSDKKINNEFTILPYRRAPARATPANGPTHDADAIPLKAPEKNDPIIELFIGSLYLFKPGDLK